RYDTAGLRVIWRRRFLDLDRPFQMAGHATITRSAGREPVDEPANPAAENLAERPWFPMFAHQSVEVIFRRLVIPRTDADVARGDRRLNFRVPRLIHEIRDDEIHLQFRPALGEPRLGQVGLECVDTVPREDVTLDVVGLVDVRLDQSDATDAGVAGDKVQNRHAAAPRANLEEMDQGSNLTSREVSR